MKGPYPTVHIASSIADYFNTFAQSNRVPNSEGSHTIVLNHWQVYSDDLHNEYYTSKLLRDWQQSERGQWAADRLSCYNIEHEVIVDRMMVRLVLYAKVNIDVATDWQLRFT